MLMQLLSTTSRRYYDGVSYTHYSLSLKIGGKCHFSFTHFKQKIWLWWHLSKYPKTYQYLNGHVFTWPIFCRNLKTGSFVNGAIYVTDEPGRTSACLKYSARRLVVDKGQGLRSGILSWIKLVLPVLKMRPELKMDI